MDLRMMSAGLLFVAPGIFVCSAAALPASTGVAVAQIGVNDKISVSGVGAVKFGMTLTEAAAAGVPLSPAPHPWGVSCFYARTGRMPGLSFTIRDGKIVRADMVKPANLKTVDGFKRGDEETPIVSFYATTAGGVSDVPLSDSSDVTLIASPEFSSGESVRRLVYEVVEGRGVIAIHAGWVPRDLHACTK
jgi:hypothetical protein